jgi:hypothetical protein
MPQPSLSRHLPPSTARHSSAFAPSVDERAHPLLFRGSDT